MSLLLCPLHIKKRGGRRLRHVAGWAFKRKYWLLVGCDPLPSNSLLPLPCYLVALLPCSGIESQKERRATNTQSRTTYVCNSLVIVRSIQGPEWMDKRKKEGRHTTTNPQIYKSRRQGVCWVCLCVYVFYVCAYRPWLGGCILLE